MRFNLIYKGNNMGYKNTDAFKNLVTALIDLDDTDRAEELIENLEIAFETALDNAADDAIAEYAERVERVVARSLNEIMDIVQ